MKGNTEIGSCSTETVSNGGTCYPNQKIPDYLDLHSQSDGGFYHELFQNRSIEAAVVVSGGSAQWQHSHNSLATTAQILL